MPVIFDEVTGELVPDESRPGEGAPDSGARRELGPADVAALERELARRARLLARLSAD
jgi:hypothetical protein